MNMCSFCNDTAMKLRGNIYLVPGGHDAWIKDYNRYDIKLPRLHILPPLVTTNHFVDYRNVEGEQRSSGFVLCHYPMLSWDKSHYGSILLHGHTHTTVNTIGRSEDQQLPPKEKGGMSGYRMDVGVDAHNFQLLEYFELRKKFSELLSGDSS